MDHGSLRRAVSGRSKTSPADLLASAAREATEELRPPSTPAVQRMLLERGVTTTMLDIALGIVRRLEEVDANDLEELYFLETCLKAGHSKTTLPCALLDGSTTQAQVEEMLLRVYGPAQFSAKTPKGRVLPAEEWLQDERSCKSLCKVERWPTTNLKLDTELQQFVESGFDHWGFDTFRLAQLTDDRALQFGGWEAMTRNDYVGEFNLDPTKLQSFLKRVESKYAKKEVVPYHNSLHAADVTQSVHAMLGDLCLGEYLDTLSCMSLVLSAVIHDMGHDGRNNNFHVNTQDDLALTYNDRSVLENFHVSQAFRLMSGEPDLNFLSGIDPETCVSVRKQVIEAVLGTDMAHHFTHLGDFKSLSDKFAEKPLEDPEAMSVLRVMILHSADISNPVKTLELSDRWTELLRSEFHQQGDMEKGLCLPISPLCDRESSNFASSQVGFMQFIVQAAFETLAPLAAGISDIVLKDFNSNLQVWKERKQKEARTSQNGLRAAVEDCETEQQPRSKPHAPLRNAKSLGELTPAREEVHAADVKEADQLPGSSQRSSRPA